MFIQFVIIDVVNTSKFLFPITSFPFILKFYIINVSPKLFMEKTNRTIPFIGDPKEPKLFYTFFCLLQVCCCQHVVTSASMTNYHFCLTAQKMPELNIHFKLYLSTFPMHCLAN